jgi:hypothetical protein
MYRELFGLALFRSTRMEVNFVAPTPEGVTLRPVCVVESATDAAVVLRAAVCTESGRPVT